MPLEFNIYNDPKQLEGTAYIEFLPGRYNGKCWNENSIFMDETTFFIFEDVIESILEGYDHYAFNELPETKIPLLQTLLEQRLIEICNECLYTITPTLYSAVKKDLIIKEISANKKGAIEVLEGFIVWIQGLKKQNFPLSILGI
ncbi:hypothetical protein [Leptospira levettii]|uniref:hypothetical protein n=1 Tax=Leptospira levettii TaxID=2023178 RepID=UPI000C2981D1|nr:hypothetical protein [Leptospira levettii]PJZ88151.1 hypothetical protein CH368_13275 [Leptospira levettii]